MKLNLTVAAATILYYSVNVTFSLAFPILADHYVPQRKLGADVSTRHSAAWRHAPIDYGPANEYMKQRFKDEKQSVSFDYDDNPYFGKQSLRTEPIHDARSGIISDDNSTPRDAATLTTVGFQLLKHHSQVTDWHDLNQVKQIYLPEVDTLIRSSFEDKMIRHVIYWLPRLRDDILFEEQLQKEEHFTADDVKRRMQEPTLTTTLTGFVATAHIDTDVSAYDNAEHFISLFEKNRVNRINKDDDINDSTEVFPKADLVQAVQEGHRFIVVNVWRNIDSTTPIRCSPLALMATRYNDIGDCVPTKRPNLTESHWYVYPKMTSDEVLLFCQYDRDSHAPSDIWHSAVPSIIDDEDGKATPRRSFDVRCLIVLDEIVPPKRDRMLQFRQNLSQ